jgi:hypothetical protein
MPTGAEATIARPPAEPPPEPAMQTVNDRGPHARRNVMPILETHIETERASRYLVQFCKHAAAMGSGGHSPRMHLHGTVARREVQVAAEWSDTSGTVTFTPWGLCTLNADTGILSVRIDTADEDGLAQIRDVVTRDFARFSQRDPLTVTWQRSDDPDAAPFRPTGAVTSAHQRSPLRAGLLTALLVLAVLLIIGLHIGLAGAAVADSRWTGIATDVMVALVLLKIVLVVRARMRIRRRRTAKTPAPSRVGKTK